METFDAIILGAGAAGLMAAITASNRGRRVLLLDHADQPGKKILISGGGRCNFTNLYAAPDRYHSANPHFARSALARYTQHDFIDLVNRHRIPWHEKTLGQLFCDGSARAIVQLLLDEAAGADIRCGHSVTAVRHDGSFVVETSRGSFRSAALVLATGGPSIPKMGATGFAYDVARQFGLPVIAPAPGLVPLTFDGGLLEAVKPLAGVATEVIVSGNKTSFREAMLFTHRGLSGPAILQISSLWRPGASIRINMAPDIDMLPFLKDRRASRPRAELRTVLAEVLPARLAEMLATLPGTLANMSDKALAGVAAKVNDWTVTPSGSEGFAKAEVTIGGIDTAGLSSKTMAARALPGLYCIGEAVDVTGWLGGYNFQWAWSSGYAAGMDL